ncbi:MAG: HAD family hydrolase [Lachnospiraceae bacterium]|jgi:hypothetical protein|nr:HAD family hydrolase [Lachnospiraceae bacterium]
MRKYRAIFFDWDGTAVTSRLAPVGPVIVPMTALLDKGIKLVIISGTSYENIAEGKLAERFPAFLRQNLFLGLGRGARNYSFDREGKMVMLEGVLPNKAALLTLHKVCFQLHEYLHATFDLHTDIVFTRDNYCKIDLCPDLVRGEQLYFRGTELTKLNKRLGQHGYRGGIRELLDLSVSVGREYGLRLFATTDAKYLELGFATKSDNVNTIFAHLNSQHGISACDCCYWGDEFVEMGEGIYGSDAGMITKNTHCGDFFDVSDVEGQRPVEVCRLGGGVDSFRSFLYEQVRE